MRLRDTENGQFYSPDRFGSCNARMKIYCLPFILIAFHFCSGLPASSSLGTSSLSTRKSPLEVTTDANVGQGSASSLTPHSVLQSVPSPYDCDFENGLCGWQQATDDNFNWTRHTGYTDTAYTGPTGDHTNGTGYYVYTESSYPRKLGERARLVSPVHPPTSGQCLQFYYNMFGTTLGTLGVYLKSVNGDSIGVWNRTGDKCHPISNRTWFLGEVDLVSSSAFTIVFEGILGDGVYSDMALDDIKMSDNICGQASSQLSHSSTTVQGTATIEVLSNSNKPSTAQVPVIRTGDFRQAIHLECLHYGWMVTVDLSKLSPRPSDVTNIHMATDSCTGILHGDMLVFNRTYNQCGTHAQVSDGKMTFNNYLQYATSTTQHGTRDIHWQHNLQCSHELHSEHTFHIVPNRNVSQQGSSSGKVRGAPFDVRLFSDPSFRNPLQESAAIGSPVYVQVVSLNHPDVVMVLDSCEARVNATNPGSEKPYPLIEHHCSVESTTNIMTATGQMTLFKFNMFDLPEDQGGIFVTCAVNFCERKDLSPGCVQKCQSRPNPPIIG